MIIANYDCDSVLMSVVVWLGTLEPWEPACVVVCVSFIIAFYTHFCWRVGNNASLVYQFSKLFICTGGGLVGITRACIDLCVPCTSIFIFSDVD